jgi:hypothetical protein
VADAESSAAGKAEGANLEEAFAKAAAALQRDRSEKVRIQAALVLGRTGDPRAVPFLIKALGDRSPGVRAVAAKALGASGNDTARPALETAARDPHPLVRKHAGAALETLKRSTATGTIEVMPMGDRTNRASIRLRERMREIVADEVAEFGKRIRGGYVIDGVIKNLTLTKRPHVVEVNCAVELVISTRAGIVLMSGGEAAVQKDRRVLRSKAVATITANMEMQALENAVIGAYEELRKHFAAQARAH